MLGKLKGGFEGRGSPPPELGSCHHLICGVYNYVYQVVV